MLQNLVVLPKKADRAWSNISQIVNVACKPALETYTKMAATSTPGDEIHNAEDNPNSQRAAYLGAEQTFPSFQQLHTMLEIRELQGDKAEPDEGLKSDLNAAREKQLALEDALMDEKNRIMELQKQLKEYKEKEKQREVCQLVMFGEMCGEDIMLTCCEKLVTQKFLSLHSETSCKDPWQHVERFLVNY